MKQRAALAALCLGFFAAVAMAQDAQSPDEAGRLARARVAAKSLAEALKSRLVEALATGGPAAALETCNKAAQPLTAELSNAQGLTIRRTAIRVRNQLNAPSPKERAILEEFASKLKAGADVAKLEHAETVKDGPSETFLYMKAIPMSAEPCSTCHGTEVKPDLQALITKLYPNDTATGFTPGDLRGAFVVTQKIK